MSTAFKSVDDENLKLFTDRAGEWWDPHGPFKPLHDLNPARLTYLEQLITAHALHQNKSLGDMRLLDVGCGGGLISEPLAEKGMHVTGLDAGEDNIKTARQHAEGRDLSLSYIASTLEDYVPENPFDVVTALELIEHVTSPDLFLKECHRVLKPSGLIILSTLNRTALSFLTAIVGAEYILGWVPKGTHHWQQFITPAELSRLLRGNALDPMNLKGLSFQPLTKSWHLSQNVSVNYFIAAQKRAT